MSIFRTGVVLVFLFTCFVANAKQIEASNKNATLAFAGKHAGMAFDGIFEKWNASLILPPSTSPKISAQFTLESAKTGDSTYDDTLPEDDWFDIENHPTATFVSTSIKSVPEGFDVSGVLTLKNKEVPVAFVLKDSAGAFNAAFKIDRLAHGIGVESDPDAEWVSQFIDMTLSIPAN